MREVLGVYRDTITVFNYHAATGRWFPSVISGADLLTTKANSATTAGGNNADAVDIIVHCTADKRVPTGAGMKSYMGRRSMPAATIQRSTSLLPRSAISFLPVRGPTPSR